MCFRYCDTDVQANNTVVIIFQVEELHNRRFWKGKWLTYDVEL